MSDSITEIKHSERTHAKFSPSSLEARELCPGWNDDNDKETPWASDGEKCHEATQAKILGDDIPQTLLNPDLASFVQECYDYAAPRIAGAETIVTESRLYHSHPLLRECSHGTPDVYAITGDTAQLLDFKFGRRPVTKAETNLQGWAYALALFDTYDKLENITIHFIVPRVHRCTSSFSFNRTKDYDRMLARVCRVVERVQANKVEDYNPSWSACAYCGCKSGCEALGLTINRIYELATDEISDVRVSEAVKSTEPKDLGFLKNVATVVTDWAEQQQERLKKLALEGNEVSGYEIRFARGRTTVNTVDKVLAAGIDIPIEKIVQSATIPLVELRRIYTDGVLAESKKDKETELMTKLAKGGALKSGEDSAYLFRLNENN